MPLSVGSSGQRVLAGMEAHYRKAIGTYHFSLPERGSFGHPPAEKQDPLLDRVSSTLNKSTSLNPSVGREG